MVGTMFHGNCVDCVSQQMNGIEYCSGCKYREHDWSKPNLCLTATQYAEQQKTISLQAREGAAECQVHGLHYAQDYCDVNYGDRSMIDDAFALGEELDKEKQYWKDLDERLERLRKNVEEIDTFNRNLGTLSRPTTRTIPSTRPVRPPTGKPSEKKFRRKPPQKKVDWNKVAQDNLKWGESVMNDIGKGLTQAYEWFINWMKT